MKTNNLKQGILVFTNKETLNHKKIDGREDEGEYCYWETKKIPKKFIKKVITKEGGEYYDLIEEFPFYFAIDGKIKGYFLIDSVDEGEVHKSIWMIFYSESWNEIKNGEILKPSQGWRYYPK